MLPLVMLCIMIIFTVFHKALDKMKSKNGER